MAARPALRGTMLALVSAIAFGVTTPLVQRFGRGASSFAIAALLYGGAAIVGVATRSKSEARVERSHAPRIALVAIAGALVAPVLLAWGLARTSGIAASLMLNLEAVFTVVLAKAIWSEHVGRRVAVAAAVLAVGGALLVIDRNASAASTSSAIGLAAIAGASLAWALDNALAKPLSALDPSAIVGAKGAIGAVLSAGVAIALGASWPGVPEAIGLAVVGGVGYGMSLRLYLRAQRELGAGRTASVFASAPFCGAALAWALGEPAGIFALGGAVLMIVGLVLHLTEEHEHRHHHHAEEHEHAHRHDDGHHDHAHDPMPEGEHTHVHRHAPTEHAHPHVPDLHHGHDHDHEH